MQKLINPIQNYSWGSKTAFTELFNFPNASHQPQAELWMGAHYKSSSEFIKDEQVISLAQAIQTHPIEFLGEKIFTQYGELPFLFKLLSAAEPLSIQVHPDKITAEQGYDLEEKQGISIDSPQRNYKDRNHKPELIYALTPFVGLNAFRPINEIINLFTEIQLELPELEQLKNQPTPEKLLLLFKAVLMLSGEKKSEALNKVKNFSLSAQQPWKAIHFIAKFYPNDNGLLCPLLLNVVELQPGEAMFLAAQTPHAYLYGTGLEIMANSDNVLRAGLTAKHIDVPELIRNVQPISRPLSDILIKPHAISQATEYPVPTADFGFSIYELIDLVTLTEPQPTILFSLEGDVTVTQLQNSSLTLKKGESCFIKASDYPITISGKGKLAMAYTKP